MKTSFIFNFHNEKKEIVAEVTVKANSLIVAKTIIRRVQSKLQELYSIKNTNSTTISSISKEFIKS